jgi:hypothetical protein
MKTLLKDDHNPQLLEYATPESRFCSEKHNQILTKVGMVLNNQLPAFSSGEVLKLQSNHLFCSKVLVVFLNFTLV